MSTVSDIKYKHHDDALTWWKQHRPQAQYNTVNDEYLKRPLLIITLELIGSTGYLPGMTDSNLMDEVYRFLGLAVDLEPSEYSSTLPTEVADRFKSFFRTILISQGFSAGTIDWTFPVLFGIVAAKYVLTGGGSKKPSKDVSEKSKSLLEELLKNIHKVGKYIVNAVGTEKGKFRKKTKRKKKKNKKKPTKKKKKRQSRTKRR